MESGRGKWQAIYNVPTPPHTHLSLPSSKIKRWKGKEVTFLQGGEGMQQMWFLLLSSWFLNAEFLSNSDPWLLHELWTWTLSSLLCCVDSGLCSRRLPSLRYHVEVKRKQRNLSWFAVRIHSTHTGKISKKLFTCSVHPVLANAPKGASLKPKILLSYVDRILIHSTYMIILKPFSSLGPRLHFEQSKQRQEIVNLAS